MNFKTACLQIVGGRKGGTQHGPHFLASNKGLSNQNVLVSVQSNTSNIYIKGLTVSPSNIKNVI